MLNPSLRLLPIAFAVGFVLQVSSAQASIPWLEALCSPQNPVETVSDSEAKQLTLKLKRPVRFRPKCAPGRLKKIKELSLWVDAEGKPMQGSLLNQSLVHYKKGILPTQSFTVDYKFWGSHYRKQVTVSQSTLESILIGYFYGFIGQYGTDYYLTKAYESHFDQHYPQISMGFNRIKFQYKYVNETFKKNWKGFSLKRLNSLRSLSHELTRLSLFSYMDELLQPGLSPKSLKKWNDLSQRQAEKSWQQAAKVSMKLLKQIESSKDLKPDEKKRLKLALMSLVFDGLEVGPSIESPKFLQALVNRRMNVLVDQTSGERRSWLRHVRDQVVNKRALAVWWTIFLMYAYFDGESMLADLAMEGAILGVVGQSYVGFKAWGKGFRERKFIDLIQGYQVGCRDILL